jgi:hypothetical protein
MITDEQIEQDKSETQYRTTKNLHEHAYCIQMAYEWLDAQRKIKGPMRRPMPLKHIIEKWCGRYVSSSDVSVAAQLHPEINGIYPYFNLSSLLIDPSIERLANIPETMTQGYRERHDKKDYSKLPDILNKEALLRTGRQQ